MYQFGRIYYGKNINETIYLREACSDALTLTPDFTKLSGFREILDKPMPCPVVNESLSIGQTLPRMASDLIALLKIIIIEHWDSKQQHCIAMSAGRNCRILMMCLRDLIADGFEIGEYEIRTHQHEHIYARDICEELGFPLERLVIWREDSAENPDHYRFAEGDSHPNACYGPQLDWFESEYDYSNTVYVSCGIAGALFWYPYYSNWGTLNMSLLEQKLARVQYSDMFYQARWEGRLFNPFMDVHLLGYLCAIPDWVHQQPDILRSEMIRQLGYTLVPLVYGHKYNYQFSDATKSRIKQFYLNSDYYLDFQIDAKPWKYVGIQSERNNFDMRALGMALMYEEVI
jgi:hypothetical protein